MKVSNTLLDFFGRQTKFFQAIIVHKDLFYIFGLLQRFFIKMPISAFINEFIVAK